MARRKGRNSQSPRKSRARQPAPGWLLKELCALTCLSPRTVAAYIRRGLLAPPRLRGRATRYDRDTLLRLSAIRQLKLNGYVWLTDTRRALDKVVAYGLEKWVLAQPIPNRVMEALRQSTASANGSESAAAHQPSAASAPSGAAVHSTPSASQTQARLTAVSTTQLAAPEGWHTIVLLPGLQLCVADAGGAAIQKVATRLCEQVAALAAASLG